MLDRAIATYVRRLVPLFAILALIAIPAGILGAYASPGLAHVIEALNRISTLAATDTLGRARVLGELNRYAAPGGWVGLFYLFELLLYPLARTALIVFAAQTLDGAAPTIASAYREAVRRWFPQVIVALAFAGFAIVLGIGFVIFGGLAALALFAIALLSRPVAVGAGVLLALAVFAALVAIVALAYTAWLMASVSVALEDGNPIRAIGSGMRRTFDRPLLRRTLGVALAVVALDAFGSLAIVSFAGLVEYFTRVTLLYAVIAASAGILLDGLRTIFVLLYMRDVQLRREGSDLLLAATAPAPS
jgi:hypothetical protein